jgi:hypothetical protein
MIKTKVTLSLDAETWKSFKIHCVKNDLLASDLVNDFMASTTGKTPRKWKFNVKGVAV